jgi:hypothetical protein
MVSIGQTILGAVFGRKSMSASSISRAGTSVRNASRVAKEKGDVANAEADRDAVAEKLKDLDEQFQADTAKLQERFDGNALELEAFVVQPRKTDIAVGRVTLCWTPWTEDKSGLPEKAW